MNICAVLKWGVVALVLLLGSCRNRDEKRDFDNPKSKAITAPVRAQAILHDNVNKAYFWGRESVIDEINDEGNTIVVNGLVFLHIQNAPMPLKLRSSLMHIEVLELPVVVRMDAFDAQAGQSLELLSGALVVSKAYDSPFPDVDTLRANELYMINKDIDLSEKETLDDAELLLWWEKWKDSGR